MICRPQEARRVAGQHVILDEVAARGVEQRGVVGQALRDDPVSRFRDDDIHGTDDIFIAKAGSVHRGFVDELQAASPFAARGSEGEGDRFKTCPRFPQPAPDRRAARCR